MVLPAAASGEWAPMGEIVDVENDAASDDAEFRYSGTSCGAMLLLLRRWACGCNFGVGVGHGANDGLR